MRNLGRLLTLMALLTPAWGCSGRVATQRSGAGGDEATHPDENGGGETAAGGAAVSAAGAAQGGEQASTYECVGGFVYVAVGGAAGEAGEAGSSGVGGAAADSGSDIAIPKVKDVPWTGPVDGAQSCVVGQSFCHITSVPEILVGVRPWADCDNFSGDLAACATTPTCACMCSHFSGLCDEGCSCTDTNGVGTLSCQET